MSEEPRVVSVNCTPAKLARRRAPFSGRELRSFALSLGLLALAAGIASADWPQFLGPQRNGISSETGLLDRWPTNGPPLVWARKVGTGYSAPSVRDGALVLHHRESDQEIVEAMEAGSGRTLWRHAYASQFMDPYGYNNGPRCTPLLTSNRCFTWGAEGRLLCLELTTGRLIWRRDTAREWQAPEAFFGVGSTPLLEDGKLIVMVGGQPNAGVVALDAGTGKTLWENVGRKTWDGVVPIGWRTTKPYEWTGSEKLASYSSPIAATIHGERHLFCLMRQGLVSLNPTHGEVRFSRWFQAPVDEAVNAMTPVVENDLVFISAAYYRVGSVLFRAKPDGRSFEEVWRSPADPLARDPDTGRFVQPNLEVHWSTPMLHHAHLYAFSGRNEPDASLRCVELATGRLKWSRDENWRGGRASQPAVYGRGAMILVDGKLLVLGEGGKLGLFRPNPEQPEEVCSWQVPQLHYPCWTAPVLSRKKLYLRSEAFLLCFDLARLAAR
jgi:outer membrane protein assembly factor BamB